MPRSPAPATKANELIKRLAVVAGSPSVDNFEVQRIARDANALMRSDPAGAHTVLGGISALRGNPDDSRKHHRIALTLNNTVTARFNYSISLSVLEEHEEALEVARNAMDAYPDNVELLNHAIHTALASGDFTTARDLCDRWDHLVPDHPNFWSDSARQLADAVDAGKFGEQGVRDILRILATIQRSEHARTSNTAIRFHNPPDSFLYERIIHATPAVAAEMNERLADQVAGDPELMADPGLNFIAVFTGSMADGSNA